MVKLHIPKCHNFQLWISRTHIFGSNFELLGEYILVQEGLLQISFSTLLNMFKVKTFWRGFEVRFWYIDEFGFNWVRSSMCKIQNRYICVLSNTIFPLFYHIYPSVQKAPWQVYGWQWRPRKSWDFFFMMQKLHSGVWNWTFMANKKEEWIGVSGKISILPETRLFVIFKNMLSNTFPELSLIVCSTWKSEIISGTYSTTIRWCTTGERKKHSRYFFKKHNKNINELMHQRSNDAQTD